MQPTHQNPELRIVFVEDDPNDIELMRSLLQSHRIACRLIAVSTKEQFEVELNSDPDLILSDLNVVRLDGLSALAIAKQKCPHVPFLILSGTLREETRALALSGGATACILKDDGDKLVSVIRRVISSTIR